MSIGPCIDYDFQLEKIDRNFRNLFRSALPFLDTRNNVIHTYIVYQYARALVKAEPCDSGIVIAAAILHDVGWSRIPESEQLNAFGPTVRDQSLRRKHEVEGVLIANRILNSLKHDTGSIREILAIIDGHDTIEEARTAEDAIVKDADKLWRFSEAGLRIDVERFQAQPGPYLEYLSERMDRWFLTREGRRIVMQELRLRELEYGM
jgi:HD superfamily phosphodiesterase